MSNLYTISLIINDNNDVLAYTHDPKLKNALSSLIDKIKHTHSMIPLVYIGRTCIFVENNIELTIEETNLYSILPHSKLYSLLDIAYPFELSFEAFKPTPLI